MLLEDPAGLVEGHPAVPDIVRVDHHHRTVAALAEAARLVDAHRLLEAARRHTLLQQAVHVRGPVERAELPVGADEDVTHVLAHEARSPQRPERTITRDAETTRRRGRSA